MKKFYKRLLIVFILFIILVNISTAIISLNARQLINLTFFDTRTLALIYLAKNVVIESGIKPAQTTIEEQVKLAKDAAKEFDINVELLKLMISPNDKYGISLTGGMGLTRVNPYSFFNTYYTDPYVAKDNIYAAAAILKRLSMDKLLHQSELPRAFLTENLNVDIVRKLSSQTNQLIYTLTKKYNDYIELKKEDKMVIDLFSNE